MSKVLLIGGGTMGEIILQKLVGLVDSNLITVAEHKAERSQYLATTYKIHTGKLDTLILNDFTIIICAVKPQDVMELAVSQALLISVMAGVSTEKLQKLFGTNRVIRTMPNTPAKVGLGMTVWTATPAVTAEDKQFTEQLLQKLGNTLYVENDDWIDKATAVSGSGPAYVFLFAEQLIQAAQALGFNETHAQQLVTQTLLGASQLLLNNNPMELRAQVTSKGGTTAAAIGSLDHAALQTAWTQALQAAYKRAKELATSS